MTGFPTRFHRLMMPVCTGALWLSIPISILGLPFTFATDSSVHMEMFAFAFASLGVALPQIRLRCLALAVMAFCAYETYAIIRYLIAGGGTLGFCGFRWTFVPHP